MIERCLEALSEMAPHVIRVVVDNASEDNTVERARRSAGTLVIVNTENRGFAAAVNQGVRATDAEFALLLNPDVRLLAGIDALVDASENYGLAAGRLVDTLGRTQSGFTIRRFPTALSLIFELAGINRLWPGNAVNRRYRYLDREVTRAGAVEQPAGAFLLTRRDVWEKLGGLDERFHPIWFEDVDYAKRAVDAGYQIEYVPWVTAEHDGAHSINQVAAGCRAEWWCANLTQYAAKHFGALGYRAVCAAVVLTSAPRVVAGMIQARSFTPVTNFLNIVRLAGTRLVSARSLRGGAETKHTS
ncbi:MAG TPA: glycosyltransferase [Bryobacteraceae bacterium]|nr:glycosyltransferase [Bryobacteraceae bacterium]